MALLPHMGGEVLDYVYHAFETNWIAHSSCINEITSLCLKWFTVYTVATFREAFSSSCLV